MAAEQVEVELKFDVDAGHRAPDLRTLPGVVGARPTETFTLDATYFDTEGLDLAGNKITMRRRTGGHDAGWHLKRPTGIAGARRELQVGFDEAPADGSVPAALTEPVLAHIRTRPLIPVAAISTQRTVTVLLGADDQPIAELAEDLVTAQSLLPGGHSQTWSEWEFELVGDTASSSTRERLLKAAAKALAKAGGREPSSASKLARAIGSTPTTGTPHLGKKPTALELVITDIALHRNSLIEWDPLVRVDAYDAVHQMRVATRRLRSVLTGFPDVLDPARVEHLNGELKLLARILGDARDSEVQLEIDSGLLVDESPSEALVAALVGSEESGHDRALRAAHTAMNSDRYFALLDAIDELIAAPPAGERAEAPAADITDRAIAKSRKRLLQSHAELAQFAEGSTDWQMHLHEIRKRAKRLRYRTDAAAALRRKSQARIGKVAKEIQSALGDVNDANINRHRLAQLADDPTLTGRDLFILGRIDAHQEQAIAASVKAYRVAIKKL